MRPPVHQKHHQLENTSALVAARENGTALAAAQLKATAGIRQACPGSVLHFTALPARSRRGGPSAYIGEALELEAGILAKRSDTPASPEHPGQAAHRIRLGVGAHATPAGSGTGSCEHAKETANISRGLTPRAEH